MSKRKQLSPDEQEQYMDKVDKLIDNLEELNIFIIKDVCFSSSRDAVKETIRCACQLQNEDVSMKFTYSNNNDFKVSFHTFSESFDELIDLTDKWIDRTDMKDVIPKIKEIAINYFIS